MKRGGILESQDGPAFIAAGLEHFQNKPNSFDITRGSQTYRSRARRSKSTFSAETSNQPQATLPLGAKLPCPEAVAYVREVAKSLANSVERIPKKLGLMIP